MKKTQKKKIRSAKKKAAPVISMIPSQGTPRQRAKAWTKQFGKGSYASVARKARMGNTNSVEQTQLATFNNTAVQQPVAEIPSARVIKKNWWQKAAAAVLLAATTMAAVFCNSKSSQSDASALKAGQNQAVKMQITQGPAAVQIDTAKTVVLPAADTAVATPQAKPQVKPVAQPVKKAIAAPVDITPVMTATVKIDTVKAHASSGVDTLSFAALLDKATGSQADGDVKTKALADTVQTASIGDVQQLTSDNDADQSETVEQYMKKQENFAKNILENKRDLKDLKRIKRQERKHNYSRAVELKRQFLEQHKGMDGITLHGLLEGSSTPAYGTMQPSVN